jgi:hypothetical protein
MRFLLSTAVVAFLVTGMSGCGAGSQTPAKVTGKVTYKGKPLPGGNIIFHTEKGTYNVALAQDGSGTYNAPDLPIGLMKVTVETEFLNQGKVINPGGERAQQISMDRRKAEQAGGFGPPSSEQLAARYVKIPEKYSKFAKTPLSTTLEKGPQVRDYDLTD